jgi:hypothetical protein
MKRWLLISLIAIVIVAGVAGTASVLLIRQHNAQAVVPHASLMRTANSAYKYNLCMEAYAFPHASASNPYKTGYSFTDPFRKVQDTITPHLLDYDASTQTVNFSIDIAVGNVATFHQMISGVHELDGISVILPDMQNTPQRSGIPQFIISSFNKGQLAVLDYTCPNEWVWKPNKS